MTKWWICGVALAVITVSASVLWGVAQPSPVSETTSLAKPTDVVATEATIYGVLGVWDGKLALFRGEETPETVYDVWVKTLPPEEQQKLEIGIVAPSRAAYLELIQEYTG